MAHMRACVVLVDKHTAVALGSHPALRARACTPRARMRHGHVCCFRRPRRSNAAEPEWDWEESSLNEQRGQ